MGQIRADLGEAATARAGDGTRTPARRPWAPATVRDLRRVARASATRWQPVWQHDRPMSVKLSPSVLREILARRARGESNRQLAAWVAKEHGVKISHQAIGKLVQRVDGAKVSDSKKKSVDRAAKASNQKSPKSGNVSAAAGNQNSQSRASARVPDDARVASRVAFIAGLMRNLQWRRGVTGDELATKWRIAAGTVGKDAAEAHRIVLAEVGDPDAVTVKVCTALEKVIDDSLREADGAQIKSVDHEGHEVFLDYDPAKPRRNIIDAAKAWAEITGAKAAMRVQVSGSIALDDIDALRKRLGGGDT